MNALAVAEPYIGLAPYSEADAPLFFGREAEARVVAANMIAEPLTLLYGPSGVGKSSFLQAGVLRYLREPTRRGLEAGERARRPVLVFRSWRDDPVGSLRAAVVDAVIEGRRNPPAASPPEGFAETLWWAAEAIHGSLYVILDQLEDYFLYWPHDEDAGGFSAEFPRAVSAAAGRVSFLLAVREDALAKVDRFKGRIPSLFANYVRLDHLDRDQGRRAITGPLEVLNAMQPDEPARAEDGFVEAVLDSIEVGSIVGPTEGRGQIEAPLLQLVMSGAWHEEQRRGSRVLRLATLEELGGAESILRRSVDGTVAKLGPDEQRIASEALRHLVTQSGLRIALSADDLSAFLERPSGDVDAVLERLHSGRLLRAVPGPAGEARYEIFSDLLVAPLSEWRDRQRRPQTREAVPELERMRRQLQWLRLAVAVLTLIAVVLALLLSLR